MLRKRWARWVFGARMRQHEAKHLRQAAVQQLEVLLERQVIGQIEFADARGIAAAAEILEQQGVVQILELGLRQAELAADVDADPAAPHAVARRLALGQVQRPAERAENFGQTDL